MLAQRRITVPKALSMRTSQPGVRTKREIVLRSERDSLNCPTGSTMRGSGDHHSTGCPSLNQGKTPLEYASVSRSMLSRPPAASSPGASEPRGNANRGSGSGVSSSCSHGITAAS